MSGNELFKILYFNASSILLKLDKLSVFTATTQTDMVLINEPWLNNRVNNAVLNLTGDNICNDLIPDYSDSNLGQSGGLLV